MALVVNGKMSIVKRKSNNSLVLGLTRRRRFQRKLKMIRRRILSLEEKNAALTQSNEELLKESADHKTVLKRVRNEIESYASRNAELTSAMARLMDENSKLREVIVNVNNDMNSVVRQASELSRSLSDIKTDLNVRMTPRVDGGTQEPVNFVPSPVHGFFQFGNVHRGKAQAAVGPMVKGRLVRQPQIILRRVDLVSNDGRMSNPDQSSEEDDNSVPETIDRTANDQQESDDLRPQDSDAQTTGTHPTVWEPVVRLRDVSRLLNNSSLITIPEALEALQREENHR